MFEKMAPRLAEQAINVQIETLPWDVTDALSNTALVRRLNVVRDRCKKHLLIVANFNGFLVSESKQQRAKQQLSELFRYCGGEENHAVWIEPNMNTVVRRGGLYGWLERNVVPLFIRLPSVEGHSEEPVPEYNTYFRQALNPEQAARVSLALLSLDLRSRVAKRFVVARRQLAGCQHELSKRPERWAVGEDRPVLRAA